MRNISQAAIALSLTIIATPALATPGLGEEVYPATIEREAEVEARYGRLSGRSENGADALVLEAANGFSTRFRAGILAELEREPSGGRHVSAFAVEAIHTLGRIGGIDTALYGEYEVARHGPDKVETKLLLQKGAGPLDTRLNLIAEREMVAGAPVTFGYATSADVPLGGAFRLGAAAFGDLSGDERGHHFAGPIAKADFEHFGPGDLEIETGYLFALGSSRDEARGQVRLLVAYAFPF
ncbi:MAG: hypothetical protein ABIO85_07600 [Sphingomicrobium sp.]